MQRHIGEVGELTVDRKIGGDVTGEIHAVACRLAAFGQEHEIDVSVQVQHVELGRVVGEVFLAEVIVDIAAVRQHQWREGDGLQPAAVGLYIIEAGDPEALARKIGIAGVLGPFNEGDRIPCIAGAPAIGLLAEI